ncbi:MAG: hypothetical protein ACUVV0_08170 [Anaerolineae bacterium]
MLHKTGQKLDLNLLMALGALWGLSEAGLGMYLRGTCARNLSGSIMTGVAIFFFALGLAYTRKLWGLLVLLVMAAGFKLLDALLLRLPIQHGAIANPIFAFATEVLAFAFAFAILDSHLKGKVYGRSILGGLAALVAVNLFPAVGYFTGIPACVMPGTQYPLALYYAPVAVSLAAVSCPLGMALGERLAWALKERTPILLRPSLQALVLLSLAAVVLLRIM